MKQDARVLLAGDDELFRDRLCSMLEKAEDIKVIGNYSNADEAISSVEMDCPDILVLDNQMPGMNGFEFAHRLRRNGLDYNGCIIIIVETIDGLFENLGDDTVDYHFAKDMDLAELPQIIRQIYKNGHSTTAHYAVIETAIELIIPPLTNSTAILGFIYRVKQIFHDNYNFARIWSITGSSERGTSIKILIKLSMISDFLEMLFDMPDVRTMEEEITRGNALSRLTSKFRNLSASNDRLSKRIGVILEETGVAKQGLVTISRYHKDSAVPVHYY